MKIAHSLFALILIVAFARVASADNRAKARAAFRSGSQHYNLGEFQQALESFREAYRNYEEPSFLFNIAQCERQLGHKREAVREYRAYLNNAEASSANRESVKQTIVQLQHDIDVEDERAQAASRDKIASSSPPPAVTLPAMMTAPATDAHVALVATPPTMDRKPTYKKWWVWTIVGGVVAAGTAAGVAVALTRTGPAPKVQTVLGTAQPF